MLVAFFEAKHHLYVFPIFTGEVKAVRGEMTFCRVGVKSASFKVQYCSKGGKSFRTSIL